jgi:hypothetical protein
MGCFPAALLVQALITLIVICAAMAIMQVCVGLLSSELGGTILTVLRIILWAVVAIFLVYLFYDLITCAWPRPLMR